MKHFGNKTPFLNEEIKKKIKDSIIEKYGVDNPSKSDIVIEKIKDKISKLNYYIINEKRKNTCLKKYGVDNPSKINDIKDKKKKTSLNNFEEEYWSKTKSGKQICRNNAIQYIEKQRLNNEPLIPRIGNDERECLNELQKYTDFKIKRNPKIIGYFPDGYIEELNLVIEFDERHHFIDEWITYYGRDIQKDKDYQNEGLKIFRIKKSNWKQNQNDIIDHFKEMLNE